MNGRRRSIRSRLLVLYSISTELTVYIYDACAPHQNKRTATKSVLATLLSGCLRLMGAGIGLALVKKLAQARATQRWARRQLMTLRLKGWTRWSSSSSTSGIPLQLRYRCVREQHAEREKGWSGCVEMSTSLPLLLSPRSSAVVPRVWMVAFASDTKTLQGSDFFSSWSVPCTSP